MGITVGQLVASLLRNQCPCERCRTIRERATVTPVVDLASVRVSPRRVGV